MRPILTPLVIAVGVACADASSPAPKAVDSLAFHVDSVQEYIAGTGTYDRRWVPASGDFNGTLVVSGRTATLMVGDSTYSQTNTVNFTIPLSMPDTLYLVHAQVYLCHTYLLFLQQSAGGFIGTYRASHDCHGRSSAGSLSSGS